MQKKIKIKFVDFWTGFNHSNNFFIDILSIKYHVEIVDFSPDFIIFSNFGKEHLKYKCPRLFFSSENERPNMFKADLAITMDFNTNKRHFRMPLFVYYLHQYGQKRHELNHITKEHALEAWNKKSKFCCAVISNGNSKLSASRQAKLGEVEGTNDALFSSTKTCNSLDPNSTISSSS